MATTDILARGRVRGILSYRITFAAGERIVATGMVCGEVATGVGYGGKNNGRPLIVERCTPPFVYAASGFFCGIFSCLFRKL